MPFSSKKQQRFMHAAAEKGEISKKVVRHFDKATAKQEGGFDSLPEKAADLDMKDCVDGKFNHDMHGAAGSHQDSQGRARNKK